ncbi:hypothetical protein [Microbacterium sp. ZW T5_56]|uniref:hypothetical protein n=1 Tax=Microbacterium sp. ZW T5_56 TaxID=3378081 RepID=UPI003852A1C5
MIIAVCPPGFASNPAFPLLVGGAAVIIVLGVVLGIVSKRRRAGAGTLAIGVLLLASASVFASPAPAMAADCPPSAATSTQPTASATPVGPTGTLAVDLGSIHDLYNAYLTAPTQIKLIEDSGNIEQDVPLQDALANCQTDYSAPEPITIALVDAATGRVGWAAQIPADGEDVVGLEGVPLGAYTVILLQQRSGPGDPVPDGASASVSFQWQRTFHECTITAERGQTLTHGTYVGGNPGSLVATVDGTGTTATFTDASPQQVVRLTLGG